MCYCKIRSKDSKDFVFLDSVSSHSNYILVFLQNFLFIEMNMSL